jgi:predicted phage terminase large subunit-like protein
MMGRLLITALLMMSLSPELIGSLSQENKDELAKLTELASYRWTINARESQRIPEGDWTTWLIKTGRGWGKTRTGAETMRVWKETMPIIHFIGATAGDARDVMIEGESGILQISPPWDMPKYEPSKRRLTWDNGTKAVIFSADEPDRLRGPQCYAAWCDELAAWRYAEDTWDNMMMGLRLGKHPRVIATTTPRPTKMIKELIKDQSVHVTSGTTYENINNLAPAFLNTIIKKYENTRLGRQELMAEVLDDVEGALWTQKLIDDNRVKKAPPLARIGVAIDPAVTSTKDSDETGIVVGGKSPDGHYYILEDLSGTYTPQQWANKATEAYHNWRADRVIAEVNNGGDLVETVIRNISEEISYTKVNASRGKIRRAEPVEALYEQGKVHHVGYFSKMEDQMTTYTGDPREPSPDRMDANVWLITYLMGKEIDTNIWA